MQLVTTDKQTDSFIGFVLIKLPVTDLECSNGHVPQHITLRIDIRFQIIHSLHTAGVDFPGSPVLSGRTWVCSPSLSRRALPKYENCHKTFKNEDFD